MHVRLIACYWLSLLASAFLPVHAEAPPPASAQAGLKTSEAAALQIEFGDHGGPIRRIAVDAQRNLVVTGADDKTARSWSLDDAKPQRVFRPPVGAGERGRVYGVALHPHQPWLAIGGSLESAASGHAIYVVDFQTGQPVRRLDESTGNVKRLQWASDGELLVAAYATPSSTTRNAGAVRVFDSNGTLVFTDTFDAEVYALAASSTGRFAAAALDGSLRIYDVTGLRVVLSRSHRIPANVQSLSFSPDGKFLGVGYFQQDKPPDIVDWQNGTLQSLPWPGGHLAGDLRAVAWSRDGKFIVAGGSYGFDSRKVPVIVYDAARRQVAEDITVARDSITDVEMLANGRIVYGSADGSWGVSSAKQAELPAIRIARPQQLPDVSGASNLRVSDNGQQLSWTLDGGANRVLFSLDQHTLIAGRGADLRAPRLRRGLFNAPSDWENLNTPQVNGVRVALQADEKSRAVSLLSSSNDAVLGTSHALLRIGSDGRVLWRTATHTEVLAVNTMRNDRLIVTTMLDGTARLYRSDTGVELMAILAMRNGQWIMWTPSGYYDASPGAEGLIGWAVNRGDHQAADFFPASRFRSRYYRPEVFDYLPETLSEAEALKLAGAHPSREPDAAVTPVQALPPVVDLLTPTDISTDRHYLALKIRLRTAADAPISELRVRVNGQVAMMMDKPLSRQPSAVDEREITVALPASDVQVQVFAENRHGRSEAANVRVRWTGKTPPSAIDELTYKPKLYVLSIGISDYQHIDKLLYAAKDASDFTATIKHQEGLLYSVVETKLITDAQATRDNIVDALDWLQRQVTQHDVGMIFIAGHGLNDPIMGYTFLPVNADPGKLRSTGVPTEEIRRTIASIAGKSVLFIDTCHAGNALGTRRRRAINDMTGMINELSSAENGSVVFSAATGRQSSVEDDLWKNGAFTKAVIEGLTGAADVQKSGRVTHKALDYYVSERVKQLTQGKQSPVTLSDGIPDFPLAAIR